MFGINNNLLTSHSTDSGRRLINAEKRRYSGGLVATKSGSIASVESKYISNDGLNNIPCTTTLIVLEVSLPPLRAEQVY